MFPPQPGSSFFAFFGALYPVYVRGEAYLTAHQGAEAAAEFQKILDHRGIVISDPIGALARLQLGRAFVSAGDKTKAKTAYQDFLTLWKDADPGHSDSQTSQGGIRQAAVTFASTADHVRQAPQRESFDIAFRNLS